LNVFPTARRCPGRVVGARRALLGVFGSLLLLSGQASAATYSVPRFSDTPVVSGLSSPTDLAFLPDGRILILEKAGRVRIVVNGVLQGTAALDITANVDDFSERGLLGICLHPNFVTTGWIYLYYTTNVPKNRISRFTLTGNTINPASESLILDNISSENGNHNGGTIAIGPDGKLYAAPGDSGTGGSKAQNLSPPPYEGAFSGKVLRMELDGSPAAGNPFLGDATKEPRIWAYGFRNPFRFSFRPNGSLYVADVGQSTREELDVVTAGGNYGWPYMEGFIQQPSGPGACPVTTTCLPPVFDYIRSVGTTIIGGVFVTGNAYPTLTGRYVFGDNGSSWIKWLEFDGNDALIGTPATAPSPALHDLATSASGPVAFHQGPDGNLYYVAISTGRVYRIDYARDFFTVTPCRVFDTRDPAGPWGGPSLVGGQDRTFAIAGRCGIPSTARAISINVTVTGPTAPGFLTLSPTGAPPPLVSTINFRAGQTRANNAIVTLGGAGDIVVRAGMPSGNLHVILDVNGYFD
jgi:glucose/arabinose dehydrogenase